MVAYINFADPPSKQASDINDNFAELAGGGGDIPETSYLPTDGSIPVRSVANENFTGGRLKATSATDPDDCVILVQLDGKPNIATTAPAALAAASAVGTSATAARSDHVHPFPAQLATGRTIGLTGGATGTSAAFTGAGNATIAVTLATPTATVRGGVLRGAAVADATDEATVVTQFNELLAQLRVAGIIAA